MSKNRKTIYILSTILGAVLIFKLFSQKKEIFTPLNKYPELKLKKESQVKKVEVKNRNLNQRQQAILKLIKRRKVVLPSDIYALNPNVSTRTLRRDMDVLVELGLVNQEGSTRDTKYILIEN
jgi:predicted HTH transcriptional regulator